MIRILSGDCRDVLPTLPDASVQCCVTSPPYWGLRSYLPDGHPNKDNEIGLERTPDEYVAKLVDVFREVRRVLRDDGTVWLNLGDCYATGAGRVGTEPGGGAQGARWKGSRGAHTPENSGKQQAYRMMGPMTQPNRMPLSGLKPKDLIGIPWRVAFALQADGWWLRQDIIWSKPNPMPESVTDRCTKSHEYLFLLTKSERYHYDAVAIKDPAIAKKPGDFDGGPQRLADGSNANEGRNYRKAGNKSHKYVTAYQEATTEEHRTKAGLMKVADVEWSLRNKRSVWTIATAPYPDAHFATFPPELIEPCILAGCPVGGTVLDPFSGAGTTALVSDRLGRDCIGIELNQQYCDMARGRVTRDAPLFADVAAE